MVAAEISEFRQSEVILTSLFNVGVSLVFFVGLFFCAFFLGKGLSWAKLDVTQLLRWMPRPN